MGKGEWCHQSPFPVSMRPEGLEPPRVAPPAPKAGASANSATVASVREMYLSQVPLSSLQCLWELADESSTRRYCRSLACPCRVCPRPPGRRSSGKRQGSNLRPDPKPHPDRKSTRLNSSHTVISYAVFCLKKKKKKPYQSQMN